LSGKKESFYFALNDKISIFERLIVVCRMSAVYDFDKFDTEKHFKP